MTIKKYQPGSRISVYQSNRTTSSVYFRSIVSDSDGISYILSENQLRVGNDVPSVDNLVINQDGEIVSASSQGLYADSSVQSVVAGQCIIDNNRVYSSGILHNLVFISGRNLVGSGAAQQEVSWFSTTTVEAGVNYVVTGTRSLVEGPLLISTATNRLTLSHLFKGNGSLDVWPIISQISVNTATGALTITKTRALYQTGSTPLYVNQMIWDGSSYYLAGYYGWNFTTRLSDQGYIIRLDQNLDLVWARDFTATDYHVQPCQIHVNDQDQLVAVFRARHRTGSTNDRVWVQVLSKSNAEPSSPVTILPGLANNLYPSGSQVSGSTVTILVSNLSIPKAQDLIEVKYTSPQTLIHRTIANTSLPNIEIDEPVTSATRAFHNMSKDSSGNIVIAGQLRSQATLNQKVGYVMQLGNGWSSFIGESGDWTISSGTGISLSFSEPVPGYASSDKTSAVSSQAWANYGIVKTGTVNILSNFRATGSYISMDSYGSVTELDGVPLNQRQSLSLLDLKDQFPRISNTGSYITAIYQTGASLGNNPYTLTSPKYTFFDQVSNRLLSVISVGDFGVRHDVALWTNQAGELVVANRPNGTTIDTKWAIIEQVNSIPFLLCVYNVNASTYRVESVNLSSSSATSSNNLGFFQIASSDGMGISLYSVHDDVGNQYNSFWFEATGRYYNTTTGWGHTWIGKGYYYYNLSSKLIQFKKLEILGPTGPYSAADNSFYITFSKKGTYCGKAGTGNSQYLGIIKYDWFNDTINFKSRIDIGITFRVNTSPLISDSVDKYNTLLSEGGEIFVGSFADATKTYFFVIKLKNNQIDWYRVFSSSVLTVLPGHIKIAKKNTSLDLFTDSRYIFISYTSGIMKLDWINGDVVWAKRFMTDNSSPGYIYDLTIENNGALFALVKSRDFNSQKFIMRVGFDLENYNDSFASQSGFSMGSDPEFRQEAITFTFTTNSAVWNPVFNSNLTGALAMTHSVDYSFVAQTTPGLTVSNKTTINPSKTRTSITPISFNSYYAGGNFVPTGTGGRFSGISYNIPSSSALDLFKYYESPDYYTFIISQNYTSGFIINNASITGWDGIRTVRVLIPTGIIISSNATGTPALSIGGSWANGIVVENYGYIVGMGGAGGNRTSAGSGGGNGIEATIPVTIDNYGTIAGGGGGGGAGASISPPDILSANGADSAPGSGGASGLTPASGGTMPTQPYGDWSGYASRNLITDLEIASSVLEPGPTANDYKTDLDNFYWDANLDGTDNLIVWDGNTIDDEAFINTNELQWAVTVGGYNYFRNISSGFVDYGGRRVWQIRRVSVNSDPVYETGGQINYRSTNVPNYPNFNYASPGGQGGAWGIDGDTGSRYFSGDNVNYFEAMYNYQGFSGGSGGYATTLSSNGRITWRNFGKIFGRYYNGLTLRNNPRQQPSVRDPSSGFTYATGTYGYFWAAANNISSRWDGAFLFNITAINPALTTWSQGDYTYLRGTLQDATNSLYSIARISISKYNQS